MNTSKHYLERKIYLKFHIITFLLSVLIYIINLNNNNI